MKIITVKSDNGFLPPFAYDYDKVEDQVVTKLWQHRHPNGYIADPLGYDQCVALMYDNLDKTSKWIFDIICGKVDYIKISKEDYDSGIWKTNDKSHKIIINEK